MGTENHPEGESQFSFLRILGEGSFGKVMLAKKKATDELYAIKIIKKQSTIRRKFEERLETEERVMSLLKKPPFLVEMYSTFQSNECVYFVMEFVNGGDLFFHLDRCEKFEESTVRFYMAEIAVALFFLHASGVIYRDLKPENVMLAQDGHIKIVDFGLCKEGIYDDLTTKTSSGTPEYMAPEVILCQPFGKSADWWSYGVLLYELLVGESPFGGNHVKSVYDAILNNDVMYPDDFSMDAKEICTELLNKTPERRLGYGPAGEKNLRDHQYFQPIDWIKIENRQVEPPYKPDIKHREDVGYFDSRTLSSTENLKLTDFDGFSCHNCSL